MEKCKLVPIGGLEIVQSPAKLKTVLGSCVGIFIHDRKMKFAGLAHSILPSGDEPDAEPGKFADRAVDNIVRALKVQGVDVNKLQSKLVGGATMFGKPSANSLGERNVETAREQLERHGIPVIAEAVGGTKGRKMMIDPETGMVEVELIGEERVRI